MAFDDLALLDNLSVARLVPLDFLIRVIDFGQERLVVATLQAAELCPLIGIAHCGRIRVME